MALQAALEHAVVDDAVEFVFTVENVDADPVTLDFRSGKTTDLAISENSDEVWRWSDGRLFTQALQTETLAPGESLDYEMTWNHPSRGTYVAVATLEATNADVEARAEFEV